MPRPSALFPPAAAFLALLLAGCYTPAPPHAPPPGRVGQRSPAARSPTPRWQPAPVVADGATVPGGRRHIVKRGETGLAIARAYGVPWSRIASANRIGADATIYVGQALFVPTGGSNATAAPAAPATGARPSASGDSSPGGSSPGNSSLEEQAAAFQLNIDDLVSGSTPAERHAPPPPRTPPRTSSAPPPAGAARIPALSWPVDGRVILSHFGPKDGGRVNDGINIRTTKGATVRAAAAGDVIYVGDAIAGFGLMILLRHQNGMITAYAHLDDALVGRGDKVGRDQPIARAGASGNVSEPQLHFELRNGRQPLDPLPYLPR